MIAIALQIGLVGVLLNGFAALFISLPQIRKAFQAASWAISLLFSFLFKTLGLLVAWDVAKSFL